MRGVTTEDVTTARAWADTVGIRSDEGLELLTARLSARRRGRRWQNTFITVAVWAFAIWSIWNRENDVETLQPVIALYVLFTPALLVGFLRQVALDRRMAAGLTRRVAGAEPHRIVDLVDAPYRVATAIGYGGALAIGVWGLLGTPSPEGRTAATTMLAGLALFGLLAAAAILFVARRPAIAIDEQTLRADVMMRREDATLALAPYPLLVALVVAAGGHIPGFDWHFVVYAVVAGAAYTRAWWRHYQTEIRPRR